MDKYEKRYERGSKIGACIYLILISLFLIFSTLALIGAYLNIK